MISACAVLLKVTCSCLTVARLSQNNECMTIQPLEIRNNKGCDEMDDEKYVNISTFDKCFVKGVKWWFLGTALLSCFAIMGNSTIGILVILIGEIETIEQAIMFRDIMINSLFIALSNAIMLGIIIGAIRFVLEYSKINIFTTNNDGLVVD